MSDTYFVESNRICKNAKEGPTQLTNFRAQIDKELIYHDAQTTTTHLVITGQMENRLDKDGEEKPGKVLPEITIPATDFAGLSWIADKWGTSPILFPQGGVDRDVRTAIQLYSQPEQQHIYTHTGWTDIDGRRTYLTMTGGIDTRGLRPDITVRLPTELSNYALPAPTGSKEAFLHSLRLVNLGPFRVTFPILLATYRAALGPADFAVHVAGRTGTFKSELASLFQSHYGQAMDARHLPASWSSTANAIEALAYRAANTIFVLDDFVPVGTAWQVRALQKTADQIIRAQGNQSGRSRLTDMSNLQTTYYPRGIILSTGEDIPEGHSVRGRMMIVELSPGEIETKKLSEAQEMRGHYPHAMADWILWNAEEDRAEEFGRRSREYRDQNLGTGHSRTPPIIGDLLATAALLMDYALEHEWITEAQATAVFRKAQTAITEAAGMQITYLESADAVTAFTDTIKTILTSGLAHVKTRNGGIPRDPERFGYTKQESPGSMAIYKSNGPRLGWVDLEAGELLIDPGNLVFLKKYSGGRLAITPQVLMKRLKEAGILTRTDDARLRNTIRLSAEGHQRNVLAISLEAIIDEPIEGDQGELPGLNEQEEAAIDEFNSR